MPAQAALYGEQVSLFARRPITIEDVFDIYGGIDANALADLITQKTGLKKEDLFLKQLLEIKISVADTTEEIFNAAFRQSLLSKLTKDNYRSFAFASKPDLKDPFQLPRSEFQDLFNCLEYASGTVLFGAAYLSAALMPYCGVGFLLAALCILLSPGFLLANRLGALATETNQMSRCVAALTWTAAFWVTCGENYAVYHNIFNAMNAKFEEGMSAKAALALCHYLCFCMATLIFSANVWLAKKPDLGQRFPSEEFKKLLESAASTNVDLGCAREDGTKKTALVSELKNTKLPELLLEAKGKGGDYQKAVNLFVEAHLALMKKNAQAAKLQVTVQA